eukprot:GILJ01016821.1.p1 GENE.GILJ01016821.1~~GILJ01016821.1.p1  ORF type:complete len:824 (-),score=66.69 GILJ01016821.1:124-2328(-)
MQSYTFDNVERLGTFPTGDALQAPMGFGCRPNCTYAQSTAGNEGTSASEASYCEVQLLAFAGIKTIKVFIKPPCPECSIAINTCQVLLSQGFMPCTPSFPKHAISCELLDFFYLLHSLSPRMSLTSFICALEQKFTDKRRRGVELRRGQQAVRLPSLNDIQAAHREYRWLHKQLDQLQASLIRECPLCFQNVHSISIDGLLKLYHFNDKLDHGQSQLYDFSFAKTELYEKFKLDLQTSKRQKDPHVSIGNDGPDHCSRFRANISTTTSHAKKQHLSSHGILFAGCKHMVVRFPLLDMCDGPENLSQQTFVIKAAISALHQAPNFIISDIACKIGPFLRKRHAFSTVIPQETRLAVNEMHAYGHVLPCQRRMRLRRQQGAGLAHGETNETINSYLGQYAYCTRKQLNFHRKDHIFLAADFWNCEIIKGQPGLLYKRTLSAVKKLRQSQDLLIVLQQENNMYPTLDDCSKWKQQELDWIEGGSHLNGATMRRISADNDEDYVERILNAMKLNINVQISDLRHVDMNIRKKAESSTHVSKLHRVKQSVRKKLNKAKDQYTSFVEAHDLLHRQPAADELEVMLLQDECDIFGDEPMAITRVQRSFVDLTDIMCRCKEELHIVTAEIISARAFFNNKLEKLKTIVHELDQGVVQQIDIQGINGANLTQGYRHLLESAIDDARRQAEIWHETELLLAEDLDHALTSSDTTINPKRPIPKQAFLRLPHVVTVIRDRSMDNS